MAGRELGCKAAPRSGRVGLAHSFQEALPTALLTRENGLPVTWPLMQVSWLSSGLARLRPWDLN